jgi:lysophospholipase L1-like esterase
MTTPLRASRYVAIGSSFAAGPGIRPAAAGRPAKARQSRRNYPHLLAHRFGFDLVDVTSSGSTVDDILRSSQLGQPAQITAVTARTDLVSVTAGGNDIGYIPSLIAASLPGWISRLPALGDRLQRAAAPAQAAERLSRTAGSIGRVFAAIKDRAPDARIVCVDYLTVLPPTYHEDLPFDEPAYHALAGLASDLGAALARASSEYHVDLVKASEYSIGHHAWSDERWTSGWAWPRPGGQTPFHPNADGMTAVAGLIAERLTPVD